MAAVAIARTRRRNELSLGLLVIAVTVGGYILVALADGPKLPPNVAILLAWVFGLYFIAHVAVRRFAPASDGTLLPLAAMLNGIGFVMIARLAGGGRDYAQQARVQSVWVTIAIAVFVATLIVVRDVRVFERYRYIALLLGIMFMLLPLAPHIGQSRNGARLWVGIGPLSFEPNEIAKVLLVAFFAAYLADKRELLTQGRIRIGRWFVPAPRDLGPLLLAWGMALLVLAYEQDIGTSLLFFGVFAAMLYMTTRRSAYLVLTVILLVVGAVVAYKAFGRVRVRVENWTNPWPNANAAGRQPVQGWYALGSGGIAGTGLGLGQPWQVPLASTDYMFTSIGEELGLIGSIGVIAAFMLFVGSAYRIAIDAARPFTKLFAAGIATIVGLQTFLIIGGVTRVIPLTGISLPFVSYGGSSLVANFALLAILLRISDSATSARAEQPADTS
ncbi:MAG TPA: FtsW/RodA/SpoVE family cell cycle protein [Acidimicrobiia bacterium]|nr:FtsW/RodA/SpoVE family cell cycle protein [Acidimicrobiia bacterium]